MSIAIEEIARNYIRYGAKRLGIEDRLNRFTAYVKNRETKCAESDVVLHYVDSVFLSILNNSEQLAVAVSNRDVPRYYRNRLIRALNTKDKAFIMWFLKNYVMDSYTDVDALVSNNYQLLPWFFGYNFTVCPITGGSCANNAVSTCVSVTALPRTGVCCTGNTITNNGNLFNLVDNVPWISSYSTGNFGISIQVPTSAGTFTLTGSVTGPKCFPSSGVTLNLDLLSAYTLSGGTCASSCPSGTVCGSVSTPYCPGTTYAPYSAPVLYYSVNLTVLPNTSYSVWWSVSVS
jgi:hypothetical protein